MFFHKTRKIARHRDLAPVRDITICHQCGRTDRWWIFVIQHLKTGMTINYFSKEEMAKSLEVNKPLVDQIRKVAGDKLIDEYIAAVEEAKK